MPCPSRRRALVLAAFCWLLAAGPAQATVQTANDPTEAYPADFGRSSDLRSATLDTTSQPGKLLVTAALEFDADRTLTGVIYLDTNADAKADYAVEFPYNVSHHPALDGTGGAVGWHLRAVAASTTDCQSYDDGNGLELASGTVPATRSASGDRTLFTIPIDLASIGNPALLRWAVITQSSFFDDGGPTFYYDFLPDAANGLPALDPRNPPGGESDPWFCFPPVAIGQAVGYRVDMSQGSVFGTANQPPTVQIVQSPDAVIASQTFTLTAVASDSDGTVATYAWDLDDDGAFNDSDRVSLNYAFATPGPHRVSVRVTDDSGNSTTASRTVVVSPGPTITITASQLRPPLGEPFTVTADVTDDVGYNPDLIEWGFDTDHNGDDAEPYSLGTGRTLTLSLPRPEIWDLKVRLHDFAGRLLSARLRFDLRADRPGFADTSAADACGQTFAGGGFRAVGCFTPIADGVSSTQPIKLNGLVIVPHGGAINLTSQPAASMVYSSGPGLADIKAGPTTIFTGRVQMSTRCSTAQAACPAADLAAPYNTSLYGLRMMLGTNVVSVTPTGSVTRTNVRVPGLQTTGSATITTTDAGGVVAPQEVDTYASGIGAFGFGEVRLLHNDANDAWSGAGSLTLATPAGLTLVGRHEISDAGAERFNGRADNLRAPLDAGNTLLDRIAFEYNDARTLTGTLGVSAGPKTADGTLPMITVDGAFRAPAASTLGLDVEGRIGIDGYDVMGGTAHLDSSGRTQLAGSVQISLPSPIGLRGNRQDATTTPVSRYRSNGADQSRLDTSIYGFAKSVTGWVDPGGLDLHGQIQVAIDNRTINPAALLISSAGMTGCGPLPGFDLAFGFAYSFTTEKVVSFYNSCDMGPRYLVLASFLAPRQASRGASANARAATGSFDVAPGQRALALELDSTGGDPVVTLVAPDGTRYAMPAAGAAQTDGFFAVRDPRDNATFLGVRAPVAGRWRIEPQPGSPAVTKVLGVKILPKPHVTATVRGRGRTRTFDYDVKPIAGQKVTFVEQGSDTHRTVGTARSNRGSITFVPQDGAGRARTIVALVAQYGNPRARLTVARFTAPPLRRAAAPRHVRAKRGAGGSVTVSWSRVAGSTRYEVTAHVDDGRTLFGTTRGTAVTLPDVGAAHAVRLEVRSVDPPARNSRPGAVRLRVPLGPTIAPDPSGRTTTIPAMDSLVLRCARSGAIVDDVYRDSDRVRVYGAATSASVGKTVAIRLLATGKVVGRTTVLGDGSFTVVVALPPRGSSGSEQTRYRAEIAGAKPSPSVKLARRLMFRSMRRTATVTTIEGHVVRPLARPAQEVILTRQTNCGPATVVGRAKVVGRATPDSNGDFAFSVKTPQRVRGVAYRLRTSVRRRGSTREFEAFSVAHDMTLP